ncbi:MAG TPA: DUF1801 domain-containing protein [Dehalococcoidia bacterium]|nr:DUF1801 domain-containing protein [Dehalococcoidia bacterium]
MSPVAASVEAYLAALPAEQQAALQKLGDVIEAVVPGAIEVISYGVPTFKFQGRSLVSLGAAKNHCSFFVQSPAVMEAFADDLGGYDTAKGTIRFQPAEPLPEELVRRLVRARIEENVRAAARRTSKR